MSSLTTKKAIAYGFKELLLTKPVSKITVNDIAKQCDINRQTFYYHFNDIPNLLEWLVVEEVNNALAGKKTYDTWQEAFLVIFKLLKSRYQYIINIYHSVPHDIITDNLFRLVYPIIYSVVEEKTKNTPIPEDDKVFIADFYKYSFVAIVLKWISTDMEEDPNQIVSRVSRLVTGTIDNAIKSIMEDNK